jgi:hypothetical protein
MSSAFMDGHAHVSKWLGLQPTYSVSMAQERQICSLQRVVTATAFNVQYQASRLINK